MPLERPRAPMIIDDPLFYAIAVPCFILLGVTKGGIGAGLGSLTVPLMALAVPVPQASAIVLPVLCVMDLIGLWQYRARWHALNMRYLLAGAIVGLVVGYASFRYLDERWIRLLVGLIAVGFSLNHWFGRAARTLPAQPSLARGAFWGCISGTVSFIANSGGPPVAVYLLPQRLNKTIYVGTTTAYFAVVNYLKLTPYWWLGQFSGENLWTSAIMLPLAPVGMWLGIKLHEQLRQEVLMRWVYVLLFVAGAKLVWDGLGPALELVG